MNCTRPFSAGLRVWLKIALLCLFASATTRAWQVVRIQADPEAPRGKVTLRGRVINSVTREAVPYALVQAPNSAPMRAVLAGADGSFELDDVPAGLELSAVKPGFLPQNPMPYPASGIIRKGQEGDAINLELVPEAVIAGHIANAGGEPLEGAKVKVFHSKITEGRKSWQQVGDYVVDDEGNFRVANLETGRYHVEVTTNSVAVRTLSKPAKRNRGYPALIYYPDGDSGSSASALEISAGQHLEIALVVSEEPFFEISGQVLDYTTIESLGLRVFNDRGDEIGVPGKFEQNGTFKIEDVTPGVYTVLVTGAKDPAQKLQAETTVEVDADVKGLRLQLAATASVAVNVREDFTSHQYYFTKRHVQISLRPTGQGTRLPSPGVQEVYTHEGNLVLTNIMPGAYSVDVKAFTGYVYSAVCGSTDLLRDQFFVPAGTTLPPIEVVLRDDTGTLTATVQTPGWATLVTAADGANASPRSWMVNGQAMFTVPLGPGSYKIYAFPAPEEIEYTDPAVLAHYSSRAAQVTITPGGNATVTLDVIHPESQ